MGRQIQVYLLPQDALELTSEIDKFAAARLIDFCSMKKQAETIATPLKTRGEFTRIDCSIARRDTTALHFQYLESKECWCVDTLVSEVVEFTGCHFDGKTLKKGRLYYDTGYYEDGGWHEKSEQFISWSQQIFRIVRKVLRKDVRLNAYVGALADEWHRRGGIFVPIAIKGGYTKHM